MVNVILMSHGRLCEGMLDTLKIFTADPHRIQTLPLYTEDAAEDPEQALKSMLSQIGDQETTLIFTDILWGSVNQKVWVLAGEAQNIHIITGMNLPVILELITINPEELSAEVIAERVHQCRPSLEVMREVRIDFNNEDE